MSMTDGRKRRFMIITADESIIEQIQNSTNNGLITSIVIDSTDDENEFSSSACNLPANKRTKHRSLICVVCGATALGYNFDAITCESCKAFFRRNALKDFTTFECRRNNTCEITVDTRRRCSSCRLAKCFRFGMRADRLLTTEERTTKRQQQIELVNKSGSISNDDCDDLTPKSMKETRRPLMTTDDIRSLELLQTFYNRRFELATNMTANNPPQTNEYRNSLLDKINARSVLAMRLLLFFKQIPEFDALNVDDKVTLIKHNLMPLVIINGALSYRPDIDQVRELDTDVPWNTSTMDDIFGTEISTQVKKNFSYFVHLAQFDRKIILLALVVLIFTRVSLTDLNISESSLNDPIAVFQAQSFYTELLWKYLETVHGIEKALRIFQKFLVHFVSWKTLDEQIRSRIRENLTPQDFDEMMPIMKSLLLAC